jgi:hypothetical protein
MAADQPMLAKYANWFNVGHNIYEFVIDFGQYHEGEAEPLMHTRIVTGPAYAKALAKLLNQSVEKYETEFGSICPAGEEEPGRIC